MAVRIYLDQNILTELRERKIKQSINSNYLIKLKEILSIPNIETIYSHITLTEINQISNNKFKLEHIDLLDELNAKYIDPHKKKLLNKTPSKIWVKYKEELHIQNVPLELKALEKTFDTFSRKISGLPTESSFKEINTDLDNFFKELPNKMFDLLDNLEFDEKDLKEPYKNNKKEIENIIEKIKNNLPQVLTDIPSTNNVFTKFNDIPLGPKSFRELDAIKKLNIKTLPSSKVILAIENVISKEKPSSHGWIKDMSKTLEDKIAIAYCLMNWADYYSDDFNKVKKNRDRFLSSKNDMLHTAMATGATFLISDDKAFRMKAIAAYEYVGIQPTVCSLEEFIKKYFKLNI